MNVHKIVWQEGMPLRPQHLQHNDRYYDNQMKARTQLLGSYNWGFLALELDRQFLNMGKLVISQASGVLPDGSLFELGGNTEPLALDVPPNTSNVPIYLALPLVTGNHIEARRPEQAEVLARYTAYDLEVADSNAGEDSMVQVSCARPDFRLLLGEQQSDQAYVKLKVAVVLDTTPDGVISLDPDFVPSYLHAHASAYLLSCLKEVISMLGHRGDTIAERIRSNGKVGGAEVGDFMMLQLINRTELLLRRYLGLEQVHPEQLYRVLLTMLGDLATFGSEQASAPGQPLPAQRPGRQLPQADGGDPPGPVDGARAACHRTASPGPPVRHPGLALHDHKLLGSASFVLAASANCESEELRQRLPAHLKVGAVEHIRQLVNLHLPGIRVKPLPVAPRQIPFHSNKTYFILEPNAEDMAQLERSGGFAFHVSGEFSELELKFWAIRN